MSDQARSYAVIIPPTWVMIPVGDASDAAISALLDERFAGLPLDSYGPRKTRLGESLRDAVASARKTGGLDIILPTSTPWQVPLSVGIVISEVGAAGASADAASALLARMQNESPGSAIVSTKAGSALREIVDYAGLADDTELSRLRSVNYNWPVPGADGAILVAACTMAGKREPEYQPIVEALTELFDVMMETLVWSRVPEEIR
ncbi:hypothetical protein [Glaciihabitans sp. dw_435]|uniref:hypothetical protein n=1 Tax=Glaciihabitans sp. dw_435 TaxID=2720081 RepID=UPI001BD5AE04|nr:hypothetical protein [Glaciihabitans sp. dw_435]